MATVGPDAGPMVTPKGDRPGFVHPLDKRSLAIPERRGNRLGLGLRALLHNPGVALIFVVPGNGATLRVEGTATLTRDPQLLATLEQGNSPILPVLRVEVKRRYFHCQKAFNRSRTWDPTTWPQPLRISAGEQLAQELDNDHEAMARLDALVAADDTTNL